MTRRTSPSSSRSAATKTTRRNVPKPLIWMSDREGSVEKKQESTERSTKAPMGAWSGVVRRNGPRKSSPRPRAERRHAIAQARASARQMLATPIPGTHPTPSRKNTNAARSHPLRRAIGSGRSLRRGSGHPGVGRKSLLDEHHGDVGDDRIDASAGRARKPLGHDGLLVLQALTVLFDHVFRDVGLQEAQRHGGPRVAGGTREDVEELLVDGHAAILANMERPVQSAGANDSRGRIVPGPLPDLSLIHISEPT